MRALERTSRRRAALALAALLALLAGPGTLSAEVQGRFLYSLSNFSGPLRYDWGRLHVDQERGETYFIYRNLVRVFNASGMEVHTFGEDLDLGMLADLVVDRAGDVFILSYKDARPLVTRCDFRGTPVGVFEIRNLPAGVTFRPNRMVYRDGRFYFASSSAVSMTVVDQNGEFLEHVEFLPLLDEEARKKDGAEMFGFCVDREGSVFFTIPVLFRVYKLSPDRKITSFGRPGSAAGRFGVLGGVVTDSRGRVVVADKLKCVIMLFDKDFNFLGEFGYRGARPENLVIPDDISIDAQDRLYVTQGRRRGVSVFALAGD